MRALALVLAAALSLFLLFSPSAQALRHGIFDAYQRVFPLQGGERPVVVVLIDENAIARYGQWPWPRTRLAELVRRIAAHEPLAIGLDLVFPEPDRFSPAALAARLDLPADVREELSRLPSNDRLFADAIRGNDVVLGISAEAQPDPRFAAPPRAHPVVLSGEAVLEGIRKYPAHLGNVPELDAAAASRGVLNSGPLDQVVRVVPLVVETQGVLVPSLGVEAMRVASGTGLRIARSGPGLVRVQVEDRRIEAQDDGTAWLRYRRHDNAGTVAAAAVMEGALDADALAGKIVLVGVSGLGLQDYKTTPLREFIPGVFIHAQVAENLFNGVSLVRPDSAAWIEAALLLAFGVVLVAFIPRLSALQGIHLLLGLVAILFGTGVVAFLYFHILFDPVWPAIGTAAVFASVVVGTLSEAEKQRRVLREQAAHMAGEVDAARRIQMGLLPDPRESLNNDRRFKIAALLEPARTVGGDFYDCFMLDARRLFFVVADVSGKGLPAALFMASAKSHIRSAALRERDMGEALTRAQDEIGRENPEQLFVTAFAGALDVPTGMLEYSNAGHEPPFMRLPHGAPERIGAPDGPPLCVIEDYVYPSRRVQMQPGQWLVAVTDGATEAMNPKREFYGAERLRTVLSWMPEGSAPEQLVAKLQVEVAHFAAGAEPADDITLLALRWDGTAA